MLEVGLLHWWKCSEVSAAKQYRTSHLIQGRKKNSSVFRKYVSVPVSLSFLLILVNDLLIKICKHIREPITKPGVLHLSAVFSSG